MTKETKKYWESSSPYYQGEAKIPIGIHYGPGAPFEDQLKLLGKLKGKYVLEIGCGGAQCGIAMAKQGAKVIGMDISEQQLKFAKALAEKNKVKIKFYQGDIRKLPQIKSNSQDLVFTAWALLYVDDLKSCFNEVYRVLKKNGTFVAAFPHPFYSKLDIKTLKLKESYFKTGKYENIEIWPDKSRHKFVCYHHTISELTNLFLDTGFSIEKMIEPDSRKHYPKDPWYNLWGFTPKSMKYAPPTIIYKARKG